MAVDLRPFQPDDAEPAADAVVAGGWGAFHCQFAFYAAQPFCFGVVAVDRDLIVGTAFGTQHGPVGWLGHVFVTPDERGRGLGTRLAAAVVDGLETRGCATVVLIATDLGQPVYEKLAFTVESEVRMYAGPPQERPDLGDRLRPALPAELLAVAALDREATGEDRSRFLRACMPDTQVLVGGDGRPCAYYARTPWGGGAAVAPDPADGLPLLQLKCAAERREGRSRAALYRENELGQTYLQEQGFVEAGRSARMVRGRPLAWRPEAIWGFFSFGTG